MSLYEYLGKGFMFPIQPNAIGGIVYLTDVALINQSINDILDTPIGSRFYNEEYGSNIRKLTFEQNDSILYGLLYTFIKTALSNWEKRITVDSINFNNGLNYIECNIRYTILASNEVNSFIYPFYRKIAS